MKTTFIGVVILAVPIVIAVAISVQEMREKFLETEKAAMKRTACDHGSGGAELVLPGWAIEAEQKPQWVVAGQVVLEVTPSSGVRVSPFAGGTAISLVDNQGTEVTTFVCLAPLPTKP